MFEPSAVIPGYIGLKALHLSAVCLSIGLFATRWIGVLTGACWPMASTARRLSVAIDVVLLGAGVSLWWRGGWVFGQSPWLGAKLVLLVAYILLGSWALKRARTWRGHLLSGLCAIALVLWVVGIALAHHPAGWIALLG